MPRDPTVSHPYYYGRTGNVTRDVVSEDRFVQHRVKHIKRATYRKWAVLLKQRDRPWYLS